MAEPKDERKSKRYLFNNGSSADQLQSLRFPAPFQTPVTGRPPQQATKTALEAPTQQHKLLQWKIRIRRATNGVGALSCAFVWSALLTMSLDVSKTLPSQWGKRKGSVYATPASRDGHVDSSKTRDKCFHDKLKEKVRPLFRKRLLECRELTLITGMVQVNGWPRGGLFSNPEAALETSFLAGGCYSTLCILWFCTRNLGSLVSLVSKLKGYFSGPSGSIVCDLHRT